MKAFPVRLISALAVLLVGCSGNSKGAGGSEDGRGGGADAALAPTTCTATRTATSTSTSTSSGFCGLVRSCCQSTEAFTDCTHSEDWDQTEEQCFARLVGYQSLGYCTSYSKPETPKPTISTVTYVSTSCATVPPETRGGAQDASNDRAPEVGFITWTYNDKPMGLYIPAPTGKPLPILMYLHACHNDPVYETYWIIQAANTVEPSAVFLPTAPPAIDFTCADWGGTYDKALRPNMVDALAELDRVIRQYGFDGRRQYIYGESMGGEGVFRLLVDFPDRFAGAASVAGYTVDQGAAQMAKTPLWVFHGAEDGTSPVEADRTIYQSIKNAGGTKVKYTEYPGLDHVPAIEQARTEPGLFEWLLAQHR